MSSEFQGNESDLFLAWLRNNDEGYFIIVNKCPDSSNPVELKVPVILLGQNMGTKKNDYYAFHDLLTGECVLNGKNYEFYPTNVLCYRELIPLERKNIIDFFKLMSELTPEQLEEYKTKLRNIKDKTNREFHEYYHASVGLVKMFGKANKK